MTLPTQKTQPKMSLTGLTTLIYGPPKIGKSTWCANAPKALFLSTEPGLNALEVYQMPVYGWGDFGEACAEIAAGGHEFKTIVIDTIDNAYLFCVEYICRKHSVLHVSDLPYGKGYALVNKEFQRVLNKLALLPYGLILVSHSVEKDIDAKTGKQTVIVPTLPDKARKLCANLADLILYCDLELDSDNEGKPYMRRVVRTKPHTNYEAGDRTGKLPETLPLDFHAFEAAFQIATPAAKPHPLANVPAGGVPGFEDGPKKQTRKAKPKQVADAPVDAFDPEWKDDVPTVAQEDGWGNESEPDPDPESQPVQVKPPRTGIYNYVYAAALNAGWDDAKFDAAYQFGGLEQVAIELGMSESEWLRIQKEVA